jgi:hypothetical protein
MSMRNCAVAGTYRWVSLLFVLAGGSTAIFPFSALAQSQPTKHDMFPPKPPPRVTPVVGPIQGSPGNSGGSNSPGGGTGGISISFDLAGLSAGSLAPLNTSSGSSALHEAATAVSKEADTVARNAALVIQRGVVHPAAFNATRSSAARLRTKASVLTDRLEAVPASTGQETAKLNALRAVDGLVSRLGDLLSWLREIHDAVGRAY